MEIILFLIGGTLYYLTEIIYRGYSHWTMFLLGGLCFVIIGLLNEHLFDWKMSFKKQCLISAIIITVLELITGYIVNIKFGWNVWDYSDVPFNFMGQICLPFFFLWIFVSGLVIILDDWIRYWIYKYLKDSFIPVKYREKPHYMIGVLK